MIKLLCSLGISGILTFLLFLAVEPPIPNMILFFIGIAFFANICMYIEPTKENYRKNKEN